MTRYFTAIGLALLSAPAAAEVISSGPNGFALRSSATVAASPADTYAQLTRVGEWWNGAHSYSGDAANMTLEARAGGCFCERVPEGNGSIEHGRVVYAQPDQALRLSGALGPLQQEGVSGALTWTLKAVPQGTEITQTYVVGGYFTHGAQPLAPLVDTVMTEQFDRLVTRLRR